MVEWIKSWRQFLKERQELNIPDSEAAWSSPEDSIESISQNEEFWSKVKSSFLLSDHLINLNNGAVSSSPEIVKKAFISYYNLVNSAPSFYTWKVMEQGREIIREGLARLINCSTDEVAILRNATEALNNAILGIELKEGDEVVVCKQDYSKTISSWKQRELRDKIKLSWVGIDGKETNEEVIDKYLSAFSDKTRVLMLTHVINWNGQVLPVKPIIREAKKRNIKVILDAAHSFGILETDVTDLDCDFFVTALHKWLSGPIPSGMLYVKKDSIATTWPLASSANPLSENIRKFEELSIQLLPNILSLGYAIEFHLRLGRQYKEHRLRHLRRYWTGQIQGLDNIKFNVPLNEDQCIVIVNIALKEWDPLGLEQELFKRYKIHVTAVYSEGLHGIRITPNIYTHINELNKLVEALKEMAI